MVAWWWVLIAFLLGGKVGDLLADRSCRRRVAEAEARWLRVAREETERCDRLTHALVRDLDAHRMAAQLLPRIRSW